MATLSGTFCTKCSITCKGQRRTKEDWKGTRPHVALVIIRTRSLNLRTIQGQISCCDALICERQYIRYGYFNVYELQGHTYANDNNFKSNRAYEP
jgi:hypothetical protein